MGDCVHEGFHSGSARYDSETRTMHYVVVCDECDSVIRHLTTEAYEPRYDQGAAAGQLDGGLLRGRGA
jgi:hypothetical protein